MNVRTDIPQAYANWANINAQQLLSMLKGKTNTNAEDSKNNNDTTENKDVVKTTPTESLSTEKIQELNETIVKIKEALAQKKFPQNTAGQIRLTSDGKNVEYALNGNKTTFWQLPENMTDQEKKFVIDGANVVTPAEPATEKPAKEKLPDNTKNAKKGAEAPKTYKKMTEDFLRDKKFKAELEKEIANIGDDYAKELFTQDILVSKKIDAKKVRDLQQLIYGDEKKGNREDGVFGPHSLKALQAYNAQQAANATTNAQQAVPSAPNTPAPAKEKSIEQNQKDQPEMLYEDLDEAMPHVYQGMLNGQKVYFVAGDTDRPWEDDGDDVVAAFRKQNPSITAAILSGGDPDTTLNIEHTDKAVLKTLTGITKTINPEKPLPPDEISV